MHFKEYSLIAAVLMVGGLFEAYLRWYHLWYLFLGFALLVAFAGVWNSVVDPILSRNFWMYLITPVLFLLALFSFLTIVEVSAIQHVSIVVMMGLLWLYLHAIYLFNFNFEKYSDHAIENISNYTNLLSFFLLSIALFAGYTLIGLPFGLLVTIFSFCAILCGVQWAWASQMWSLRVGVYVAIATLLLLELFWAIVFLPTDFYVAGFLITMAYYVIWGMFKSQLYGILQKKLVTRYAVIATIATLFVVFTTVWY